MSSFHYVTKATAQVKEYVFLGYLCLFLFFVSICFYGTFLLFFSVPFFLTFLLGYLFSFFFLVRLLHVQCCDKMVWLVKESVRLGLYNRYIDLDAKCLRDSSLPAATAGNPTKESEPLLKPPLPLHRLHVIKTARGSPRPQATAFPGQTIKDFGAAGDPRG